MDGSLVWKTIFLLVESRDPLFELEKTRKFLQGLTSYGVYDVEH